MLDKVTEELAELRQAMAQGDPGAVQDEMGDLLFTCANLARRLKLDAETTLRNASGKFERRFRAMEAMARADAQSLESLDDAQLDALWERAKQVDQAPEPSQK